MHILDSYAYFYAYFGEGGKKGAGVYRCCFPCSRSSFLSSFIYTSNLPSVTYHINSSGISTKYLPEFPSVFRLDSMKKLLFCVSILKSLFDSFPHCVYRFSKIQSAKSISQQVLNYRKFLLISGSSRENSKQSNCRYYCSHCEFCQEGNSEVS